MTTQFKYINSVDLKIAVFAAFAFTIISGFPAFALEAGITCEAGVCDFGGRAVSSESPNNALLQKIHNIGDAAGKVEQNYESRTGRFAPVGLIRSSFDGIVETTTTSQEHEATAFLVSPCLMMTNHHAVFNGRKNISKSVGTNVSVDFYVGSSTTPIKGTPVKWGDYNDAKDSDWALVRLEECVGNRVGWLPVGDASYAEVSKMTLRTVGYPGDRSRDKVTVSNKCRVHDYDGNFTWVKHDCAVIPRSSGSPALGIDPSTGSAVVVGIVSGESLVDLLPTNDRERFKNGVRLGYDKNKHFNTMILMSQVLADPDVTEELLKDLDGANNPLAPIKASPTNIESRSI